MPHSGNSSSNGAKSGSKSPGSRQRQRLVPLEPAFEDAKHHIEIYQGDCVQILGAMPDECVDLIFADPPYFLSNGGITCHAGRMVSVNKGAWDRSRGANENHEFNRQWLEQCQRVLKPNGTIWVSGTAHVIHSVGFAMQQLGFKLLNDISWVKPNPPPNLSCRYFTHSTETLIWAAKNSKSRHTFHYQEMKRIAGGKQMKSVWEIRPPEKWEKRFGKHPTQKPVALLERVLKAASSEEDLVLDPFAGSGTAAVASVRLSRSVILIEESEISSNLAQIRVMNEIVDVRIAIFSNKTLDPRIRSVDRSDPRISSTMPPLLKLAQTSCTYHFVGARVREVIYSVSAFTVEEAWQKFSAHVRQDEDVFCVIKAQTEIYLASRT